MFQHRCDNVDETRHVHYMGRETKHLEYRILAPGYSQVQVQLVNEENKLITAFV